MWRKHNSKCPPHLSLFRSTFQLDSVASLVNILLLNCELVCAFVLMNMEFVDVCDRTALLYRKDKETEIFFKRLVSVNSVSSAKNVLPPVRKALANDSCFPSEMGSTVFFIWAHEPTREDICICKRNDKYL